MPSRIQRQRTKGWKMPKGAVYVGRPTIWGNPFDVETFGYRTAVDHYRTWLGPYGDDYGPYMRKERATILSRLPELRGKDLACWCRLDQPCHADVLLELANGEVQA